MVLYHAPVDAAEQTANSTPEEQAEGMKAWMDWAERCGDDLVDMGAPLANGRQLSQDGEHENSDEEISGYSILQAESLEEAISLLEDHPHLVWNEDCTIEVHETMPMPAAM